MDAVVREICRQSILTSGQTWPNPSVACVIVTDRGVFSGATEVPGRRHAEIVALDQMDQTLGDESYRTAGTMYVTLEPCSTHGRTPPCVDRIKKYPGLKVNIACMDPVLKGSGLGALQAAGIETRVTKFPGAEFLSGFLSRTVGRGPRFHLKAAALHDLVGKRDARINISGADGHWIGQMLRAKLDAVLVGPGTVALDLPGLNFRPRAEKPQFKRSYGHDIWMDSLLENMDECMALSHGPAFQPARVFLLGRPFANQDAWFAKQTELGAQTGRKSVYFDLTEEHIWSRFDAKPLPALSHPGFILELRSELAACGLNEILVEGGPGLFKAIESGLTTEDRILLIKRKAGPEGNASTFPDVEATLKTLDLALPEFMKRAGKIAEYSGQSDDLVVATYQ
ncbi:MAG: hypothetical protein K8S54_16110 [Spirochaetia bacterium]|nr:hypothetical protein [Spirochaetia bacterium]